tara:strand:+ start:3587 stop:4033 length:447 start_codon:yes stop_codon:yes gene_type:complete
MSEVVHLPCWTQVDIHWDQIIEKINGDVMDGHWGYSNEKTPDEILPTVILEGDTLPSSFVPVAEKVYHEFGFGLLDTYVSFTPQSKTLGRHCDHQDVFIVGAIGATKYRFDDGKQYTIWPGCGIYIPAGVYHEPISCTPRAILSFSDG